MPLTSYEIALRFKQLTFGEIGLLKRIAGCMPYQGHWVNIGAGHGTSALAVLEARPDLQITTVDNRLDHPSGCLLGEKNSLQSWVDMGAFVYPLQILGDSAITGQNWKGGLVDAVFIDADHSLPAVMNDWQAWKVHIKPGGIVMFHDYRCIYGPGVEATVIEAQKECDTIECVDTLIALRTKE